MRQCAKEDCLKEVISRGKYCEEHRRKKENQRSRKKMMLTY